MAVLFWNFQALGRGYAVLGSVGALSRTALDNVGAAQTALADQDFTASQQHFAAAQVSLDAARGELASAIAAAEIVRDLLDVTGLVGSGDNVLAAAQSVISAGQHMARGLEHVSAATVVASPAGASGPNLVTAVQDALIELTQAEMDLSLAQQSLASVPLGLLPAEFRQQVGELRQAIPEVQQPLAAFIAQSDVLLAVLGANQSRNYLLVFENNHELRATGGFIGSTALVHVDQGVIEKIDVESVYDRDGQLKAFIAPPEPLRVITDRWYLRDANWFVNYPVSARKIAEFLEQEGSGTVDGVIAMTPEVIRALLNLTGPISVPGYDVAVDADTFTAVTQDEVTYSYDKEVNRPKQFLADLTPILLNKVLQGKSRDPVKVLDVFTRMLHEKQLLIWLANETEQTHVAALHWDGSLAADRAGFLSVNNSNIGGHKSDQFIGQEIDYRTKILADGGAESTVTIRREHHGPTEALPLDYPDGDNPAYKDNVVYQRVFVPVGAELLEARGFTPIVDVPKQSFDTLPIDLVADADVAEWQRVQHVDAATNTTIGYEAGYQYFANWSVTKPGATSILFYRYRWPAPQPVPTITNPAAGTSVYVAKQPGDTRTEVRVEVSLPGDARIRHTVPHDGVTTTEQQFVYRGQLRSDMVVGGVWTKQ